MTDIRASHDQAYFDNYGSGSGLGDQRWIDARSRGQWIGPGTGDLLEVGSAAGHFLAEAARLGYRPVGIEQSGYATEQSVAAGAPVHVCLVEDAPLEAESFDVVCAWHVLEHLPEPLAVLERLRETLQPGGRLFVEVPNIACGRARRMGMTWPHLDPEHHLHHFAPQSLRLLLGRAGFRHVTATTFSPVALLPRGERLRPKTVARRVRDAAYVRTVRLEHPAAHDLLRAAALR